MSGTSQTGHRASAAGFYGWAWPGVPQLWRGGEWAGFAWAAAFALALNLQVLVAFLYTDLLPAIGIWTGWLAIGGFWIAGLVVGRRWTKRQTRTADAYQAEQSLYSDAFHDYLQMNWVAAEAKCAELIRMRRQDVDARLLLATVLRHAGRSAEAKAQLDALVKLEGAEKWGLEIALERRSLDELNELANNSGIAKDDGDEPATLSMTGGAANKDAAGATAGLNRATRNAA
ncbi:MAG: hypothetical protein C0483_09500 [Pirellula sp.]|nr:hypothetical protein [Pirellula sp.]